MTARDRFTYNLKCSNCNNTGKVDISENDGASWFYGRRGRNVDHVTEGFTVIDHGSEHHTETIIHCECGTKITF